MRSAVEVHCNILNESALPNIGYFSNFKRLDSNVDSLARLKIWEHVLCDILRLGGGLGLRGRRRWIEGFRREADCCFVVDEKNFLIRIVSGLRDGDVLEKDGRFFVFLLRQGLGLAVGKDEDGNGGIVVADGSGVERLLWSLLFGRN